MRGQFAAVERAHVHLPPTGNGSSVEQLFRQRAILPITV
jgi:hypothetical protein